MRTSPGVIIISLPGFADKIRREIAISGKITVSQKTVFMDLLSISINSGIVTIPPLVLPCGTSIEHLREDFIMLADSLINAVPQVKHIELYIEDCIANDLIFLVTSYVE